MSQAFGAAYFQNCVISYEETIMNPLNISTRIASLFAATLMTALIVASQFSLAGHYVAEADAVLAARQIAPVVQITSTATPQMPGT
jgi:cytosine/uracil/thiamine/allantoin permease